MPAQPIPGVTPQICTPGATFHHLGGRTPRMDQIFLGSPADAKETPVIGLRKTASVSPQPLNSWIPRSSFQTHLLIQVPSFHLHGYYTAVL